MKTRWMFLALTGLVLLGTGSARADRIFNNGLVNSFSGTDPGFFIVRDNPFPPPLTTTLNVLPGAQSGDDLRAYGTSIANVYGGIIGDDLYGYDSSVVSVFGGVISDDIRALGTSRINLRGGTITDSVGAREYSVVTIYGTGFNYAYGTITDATGTITGYLADGTPLNSPFDRGTGNTGTIILAEPVPEPSTCALFSLGIGGLALWKRRQKKA